MKIDFIVTWLDSSDPKWQEDFLKYKGITSSADQSKARYRDWELFRYWFRAVEQYAPWVNKVFLVTNGKFPSWVNSCYDKLVLIKHSDYIPEQYLPTFNSRTIEFYFNRIKDLSEYFVYFNDDFYLNMPISPDHYFRKGLPCDNNAETLINTMKYDPIGKFNISVSLFTNICVLNGHFNRKKVVRQSPKNWFGLHLGIKYQLYSIILTLLPHGLFSGFQGRHYEQPYLKSTFDDAWQKESGMLSESCTRFRERATLTPYFFRYWQLASNRFYPVCRPQSLKFRIENKCIKDIELALNDKRVPSICLNDSTYCSDKDFIKLKSELIRMFELKFPNKSKFEL